MPPAPLVKDIFPHLLSEPLCLYDLINCIIFWLVSSVLDESPIFTSPLTCNLNYKRQIDNNTNLNLGVKYIDEKYVSNDQENIEPQIPDYYIVNTSISSINGPYTLSFGINNVFDEQVYDFAVSSTFHDDAHYGLSNVYPLPDRNAFFNFGYTFWSRGVIY